MLNRIFRWRRERERPPQQEVRRERQQLELRKFHDVDSSAFRKLDRESRWRFLQRLLRATGNETP